MTCSSLQAASTRSLWTIWCVCVCVDYIFTCISVYCVGLILRELQQGSLLITVISFLMKNYVANVNCCVGGVVAFA